MVNGGVHVPPKLLLKYISIANTTTSSTSAYASYEFTYGVCEENSEYYYYVMVSDADVTNE